MTTTAVTPPTTARTPPRKTSRGYAAWMTLAALLCAALTAYAIGRYFPPLMETTEGQVRGPVHHYLLVTHIFTGAVALVTGLAQFWPRLRNRHPKVHRYTGRVYFFAGVLPSSVLGLAVALLSLNGLAAQAPLGLTSVLWFITGVQGLRHARARNFRDHREWMIRNYALTTAAISGRLWGVLLGVTIGGELVFATANWLAFTLNLLVAEWWIQRRRR